MGTALEGASVVLRVGVAESAGTDEAPLKGGGGCTGAKALVPVDGGWNGRVVAQSTDGTTGGVVTGVGRKVRLSPTLPRGCPSGFL